MDAISRVCESLGALAVRDAPLGERTTYRVGGPAAVGVTVADTDELAVVADAVVGSELAVLAVGNGSNLLVADRGFDGVAIWTAIDTERWDVEWVDADRCRVTVDAAMPLPMLARRSVAAGLTGLEWAVGVPGTVGGAVRMNAGGHGSDTSLLLSAARVLSFGSGLERICSPAELAFDYRHSALDDLDMVLDATFDVRRADDPQRGAELLQEIVRWRRANQPGGQNAGSVFVNPPGDSAGAIIERLGLKGHRIGSAEVSAKHANFIQADPGGSADDVDALIRDVARRVFEATGIELRTEIRRIGFRSDSPLAGTPQR